MRSTQARAGLTFFLCTVLLGCGSAKVEPPPVELSLQTLVVLYGQYLGRHGGEAPVDEAAFRKHVEGLSNGERESRGVSDVNTLFTSPRDKQPYVVRYGGTIGAPGRDGPPWVAYEKEGQRGKRYIGFATGQMEEVDERRLQEILSTQK